MAAAWTIDKKQEDSINCPICQEVFTDPRVLPCNHTYCLHCIDDWCTSRQPEDDVVCPVCMKLFIIPTGGLSGLPNNSFVMKLLELKPVSSSQNSKRSPCDACLNAADGNKTGRVNSAAAYCTECHEKLCKDCDRAHGKLKATRWHNVDPLLEEMASLENRPKNPSTYCDIHPTESLQLYCLECKVVICKTCYTEQHRSHTCFDIAKVADGFQEKIIRNSGRLTGGIEKCGDQVNELEKQRLNIEKCINEVEKAICSKADQLKETIESHKEQMLTELKAFKETCLKEIDRLRADTERHLISIQDLKKCIDEVLNEGAACDIVRKASIIHDTAEELLSFDSIKRALDELVHGDVSFKPSTAPLDDVRKCFGEIIFPTAKHDVASSLPTPTRVLSQGRPILAMTSLNKQLFVLGGDSFFYGGNVITVYDFEIATLQHEIDVTRQPSIMDDFFPVSEPTVFGLVACGTDNCLYMSANGQNTVSRIAISRGDAIERWPVTEEPTGLSLTSTSTLLIACESDNVLLEYTTNGSLVRKIHLQDGVNPRHAVKLTNDKFLVCKCKLWLLSDLYIVDVDGRVTRSYKQSATEADRLKSPKSLIATQNGLIVVAESGNNSIVTMDLSLVIQRELHLPVEGRLQSLGAICLDESIGRLYVANGEDSVLVFDNVKLA